MAPDYEAVERTAQEYVAEVRRAMPIDKAILYGSYASGTATSESDVDICFFSQSFENRKPVDVLTELLGLTRSYVGIYLEPKAFPTSELQNDNPFVKEVLKKGREII